MENFYTRLSYSFGNEDWKTEQKALKIQPTSRVLCITASGDRPLNLLSTELHELISIDANPMQNALFDLKKAAIKNLDYDDYISFLGVDSHPNRLQTYSTLEKDLSPTSVASWLRHQDKISRGVLYEGALEKWLKLACKLIHPFRGKKINKLFSFDDLEKQRVYLKKYWHTYIWKKFFHLSLHPWITRSYFKDPGLYAYVDRNLHIGNHIYDKLHDFLNRSLAKESILLSLLLKGRVDKGNFPPYLNKEGFEQIKKRIDRVKFETSEIGSYLEKAEENSIDCFSCSDIASYLSKSNFIRLLNGMLRTAKPGARFCMRQFLSNYDIPPELASHFKRDTALEQELEKEDCCFIYRFICGTIQK